MTLAVLLLSVGSLVTAPLPLAAADQPLPPSDGTGGEFTLTGVVTNGETGDPVAGARVTAYTEPTEDGVEPTKGSASTNDAGEYAIHLNAGQGHAFVDAEGYGSYRTEFTMDGNTTLDLALKPLPPPPERDATVSGRVVGPDGAPVAGAHVSVYHRWGEVVYADGEGGTAEVDSAEGETEPVPEEDARIREPYHEEQYEWRDTVTDADGRFTIDVYSGPKHVTVRASGYAEHTMPLDAAPGANDAGTITLEKVPDADAELTGRVVDRDTGLPVEGAWVNVNSLEWGWWRSAQTDADGRFTLTTIPGYARIDVHAEGYAVCAATTDVAVPEGETETVDAEDDVAMTVLPHEPCEPADGPRREYYPWADTMTLQSGENRIEANLKAKPQATVVIQGYVVSAGKDEAIPGAWVNVRNADTGEWGHAQADEFGSFKFLVRPGYLIIEAGAQGHFGNVATVEVFDPAAVKRVDLHLKPGTTKWAPCDDCYTTMRSDSAEASYEMAAAGDGDDSGGQKALAGAPAGGADGTSEEDAGGAATYQGTGGGLGPYGAESASDGPGETKPRDGANATPGAPAVIAVGAIAAVALVLARRHEE